MELALAFYPSLALGASILLLTATIGNARDGLKHGERMYEMGKRHGREEAALEVYELSLRMQGLLEDNDLGETNERY
jgi:hypothetical protein